MITSSNFAKLLWPGVDAIYGKTYKEFNPEWVDIFEKKTSNKYAEEVVGYSGLGLAPVKGEGSPVQYDVSNQGFVDRYVHVEYALGFTVSQLAMEDDLYDVVAERKAQELAFSIRQTKENVAANVLNRAFNSSYTFGDGVSLLNTAHPNVAGGTWANKLTTDADLSEASLEQACIDIMNLTNDRGLRINLMPKSLHIPVQLAFEATRILKNTNRPGTADRDINALVSMGMFPGGIKVNHYFTDADAWFIKTDAMNGMTYYERRADTFGVDDDFDTSNAKFKATSRYSFGCSDKRGIFGSAGA